MSDGVKMTICAFGMEGSCANKMFTQKIVTMFTRIGDFESLDHETTSSCLVRSGWHSFPKSRHHWENSVNTKPQQVVFLICVRA